MNVYPAAAGSRDAMVSTVSVAEVEVAQKAHSNGPLRDDMGVSSKVPIAPAQSRLLPSGCARAAAYVHEFVFPLTTISLRTPGKLLS